MENILAIPQSVTSGAQLQARVQGQVIAPGDARYDELCTVWNLTVDQHPALIVMAESAGDIAEAVRYARAADLKMAVQATGHGVIRPANGSLLILTSNMTDVRIAAGAHTAWVSLLLDRLLGGPHTAIHPTRKIMNATTRMRHPRRGQILLGLVGLLLIASAGCVPTAAQPAVPPTSNPTAPEATAPGPIATATVPRPSATATSEAQIPAGWAAYSNGQQCLYAINYPLDMQVTEQSAYSQLVSFEVANPDEGARNFAYISVVDKDAQSTSAEGVYNYDPAETNILLALQVGESKPVREVLDIAKWFTYQRMPDKLIGGYAAQTYVNVQPWEFPAGTKEIRYYLLLNGCTYLIGGYVATTNSDLPGAITEELFDQIVATIRLGQ